MGECKNRSMPSNDQVIGGKTNANIKRQSEPTSGIDKMCFTSHQNLSQIAVY